MKKHLKTPSRIKGKRRHGFLRRSKSTSGKNVLRRRRQKGRKKLSV